MRRACEKRGDGLFAAAGAGAVAGGAGAGARGASAAAVALHVDGLVGFRWEWGRKDGMLLIAGNQDELFDLSCRSEERRVGKECRN